jgi:hypothetical protein
MRFRNSRASLQLVRFTRCVKWKEIITMTKNQTKRAIVATCKLLVLMLAALFAGLAFRVPNARAQASTQTTFATPQEAVQALSEAIKAKDREKLRQLFGPSIKEILTGDSVQDANDFAGFAQAVGEKTEVEKKGDSKAILFVGKEKYPFAIPIVRVNDRWVFDTKAGIEEILNRGIGSNEEDTTLVCQAYVLAQWDYFAGDDQDDDGVAEFAQRFLSSPGKRDGLYWPTVADEEPSPLGPLVAHARKEGYAAKGGGKGDESVAPFHGYYFKILTGQGPSAAGGKHGYIINGNMIAGFGLVAYPATWGKSGVMTFIVNQQGKVYQKNLGPATAQIVKAMTEYNPDPTWKLAASVEEE